MKRSTKYSDIHTCKFDFASDMLLICQENSEHKEILLPDRRQKVLGELKGLNMLCGSALLEANGGARA